MRRATTRIFAVLAIAVVSGGGALADDYVLDDVTLSSAAVTYRAKRMEFSGAGISRDDMLKLLAADASTPPADRFEKLDAARIFIPEFVTETRTSGARQRVVYRDLAISGIAHGLAAAVDSAGANVESERADIPSKGRIGAIHAEGVDFTAFAELSTQARQKDDEPLRITTALFSMDGMEMDMPDGAKLTVGRTGGKNFGGRRLAAPLSSLVDLTPKPDAGPASPETGRAIAAMLSDLLTSVELATFEVNDIAMTKAADDKTEALSFQIKRLSLENTGNGRIGVFAIDGVENKSAADPLRIGRVAFTGLDLKSALDAGAGGRLAVPHFDRLDVSDVVGAQDGGAFSLARITIEARDWLELAPSSFRTRIEHAVVSLAGAAAARAPIAAALGYDKLDLTSAFDLRFDPAKGELALNELSSADPSIGAAQLSALFTHASAALFGGDLEQARAAASALVFWRADLHLADLGVLERFVAAQAKQTGKTPAAIREGMVETARILVRTTLAPGKKPEPQVEQIADSLGKFLKGAKSLELRLSAPEGLGVVDLMMLAQLGSLGERVKIEAKAQ